jgi:hypothetical protein
LKSKSIYASELLKAASKDWEKHVKSFQKEPEYKALSEGMKLEIDTAVGAVVLRTVQRAAQ